IGTAVYHMRNGALQEHIAMQVGRQRLLRLQDAQPKQLALDDQEPLALVCLLLLCRFHLVGGSVIK
ncbi:MAG: hypothetical protein Q7U14_14890, partial [Lacisediminimonas sp.]|nr:hypothetical protein [Lacisediminimonas sp.]